MTRSTARLNGQILLISFQNAFRLLYFYFSVPFLLDRFPSRLQLWQFLLHLLEFEKHPDLVRWVSRSKGEFRVCDTKGLACLWGMYHNKRGMPFGNMARTLRYYYDRRILTRSNARLVYTFTDDVMRQADKLKRK